MANKKGPPGPEDGVYETLAGESSIRLFGRPMYDIVLAPRKKRRQAYGLSRRAPSWDGDPYNAPPYVSSNMFLIEQLLHPDASLAKIHTFSYQNELYDLAKPAIFLVHGPGIPAEGTRKKEEYFWRKAPAPTARSGLNRQGSPFSGEMRLWMYEKADFTLRLDTETGSFDQVLLEFELGSPVETGSMHGANTGPSAKPYAKRRRWRSNED